MASQIVPNETSTDQTSMSLRAAGRRAGTHATVRDDWILNVALVAQDCQREAGLSMAPIDTNGPRQLGRATNPAACPYTHLNR